MQISPLITFTFCLGIQIASRGGSVRLQTTRRPHHRSHHITHYITFHTTSNDYNKLYSARSTVRVHTPQVTPYTGHAHNHVSSNDIQSLHTVLVCLHLYHSTLVLSYQPPLPLSLPLSPFIPLILLFYSEHHFNCIILDVLILSFTFYLFFCIISL